ncbi:hypothetical protein N7470_005853 [Penicillium chermesinum]|nr:hypothetical protein N7470_005853 [Penicillium chermesinum]
MAAGNVETAGRGLAFGRAGVWNKTRLGEKKSQGSLLGSPASSASSADDLQQWMSFPVVQAWGFINSGIGTFATPEMVDIALNDHFELARPNFIYSGVSPSPLLFPQMSHLGHAELFEYYIHQLCPRTTASSKGISPFSSLILPFSISASPILFKAIQALGACHLSRGSSSYAALALRLKSETLRDLRARLSSEGVSTCSADPEILIVIMMLCLYEIADKCDHNWTTHLKGAKDLIRIRRQNALVLSKPVEALDPVSDFAEHFFAFQDVMGRTACGEEVLFGSDYWQATDQRIDLWMGCSPELVSILASITEMSRVRRLLDSNAARESFASRAALLEHRLDNLVQEIDGDEDDETLLSAAEAKRLAAVIYLHCALFEASPTTPLVVEYVRKILQIVSRLLEQGALASVTWPVFVAAVELDPGNDVVPSDSGSGRSIVLRALDMMTHSATSNITRTRAVIVQVWQARDQSLLKAPQMPCNDWEWYVAPISTAMTLA